MGALSEYYVDPNAGNDTTGDGSVGTPWKTIQKALDTITRDSTNGDRVNVKAGTADVISVGLNLTTYGTPTDTAAITIQGYTSAAGDGGIGEIDCNGNNISVWAVTTYDNICHRDMKMGNCITSTIVHLDNHIIFENCEIHTTTGTTAIGIQCDNFCRVINCHIHGIGGTTNTGLQLQGGVVAYSYIEDYGTNSGSRAIFHTFSNSLNVAHCFIVADADASGIFIDGSGGGIFVNNSLRGVGTATGGTGIELSGSGTNKHAVLNNLIEGFFTGLTVDNTSDLIPVKGNSIYNSASADFNLGDQTDAGAASGNESLSASPFAKSGSDTFALRNTYYAPVNTGSVYTAYGNLTGARGAVQPSFGRGLVIARRTTNHFHL